MPTYGYRCECGHEFDAVQRMSDEPVAECPECGKKARRLFFPAGIVFKGSGFYKTDSRSAPASASSPGSDSPKPDGAKPEGSKPAAGTGEPAKPAATSTDSSATSPAPKIGGSAKPASTATD